MNGEQEVGAIGEPRRESPILFSGPMVRAILEGKKSQTRRVIKPQPAFVSDDGLQCGIPRTITAHDGKDFIEQSHDPETGAPYAKLLNCPYGRVGDRLWVRESFRWIDHGTHGGLKYEADGAVMTMPPAPTEDDDPHAWWDVGFGMYADKLRPSIFMPRFASRLTLEITEVRVSRIQAVTMADCIAEGVKDDAAFRELWDAINGKKPGCSWDDNCWVWALTFKVAEVPVKAEPSQLVAISEIPSTEQEEERAGKHPGTGGQ